MTNRRRRTATVEPPPKDLVEIPAPSRFLNYPGDCRGQIGRVMGPMHGVDFYQVLTVVTEEYDEATKKTRLGLAYGDLSVRVLGDPS